MNKSLSALESSASDATPLFRFGQERPYIVAEVSRRVYKDYLTRARESEDAGLEYAREKVSHALRSRPLDERRKKLRPKKKGQRKVMCTPELEAKAKKLINEQQQLLKAMIDKKVFPVWMQDVKESLSTGPST